MLKGVFFFILAVFNILVDNGKSVEILMKTLVPRGWGSTTPWEPGLLKLNQATKADTVVKKINIPIGLSTMVRV